MTLIRTSLFACFAIMAAACTVESADTCEPSGSSGGPTPSGSSGALPQGGCIRDRNIEASETWSATECPDGYLVKKDIAVKGTGVVLKLEPGTVVKFDSDAGLRIEESAALNAIGTADQKIVFTGFQPATGTWRGLQFGSNSVENKIAFAKIEFAGVGNERDRDAAVHVGQFYAQPARLELSDTEIVDNGRFGLTLHADAKLAKFERVLLKNNAKGGAHVRPPVVAQLKGPGIVFEANGPENLVMIETLINVPVDEDMTWPSVAPAKYRVQGQHLDGGDIVYVKKHLTIEAGAVFEMAGGSGFAVEGGAAGLKVVGTAESPVVFKGVNESSWLGITYGETTWTENRLEHVQVRNATLAPNWNYYGTGASTPKKAGILMGYNFTSAVQLTVKDLTVAGPNNAPGDIAKKAACVLVQEGTNTGTGAGGALEIVDL